MSVPSKCEHHGKPGLEPTLLPFRDEHPNHLAVEAPRRTPQPVFCHQSCGNEGHGLFLHTLFSDFLEKLGRSEEDIDEQKLDAQLEELLSEEESLKQQLESVEVRHQLDKRHS